MYKRLQSQTRSLFPRYLVLQLGTRKRAWLQSQTRSPFPRYAPGARTRLQVPIVAISNEKPVPSLPDLRNQVQARNAGCNLKREARSLATAPGARTRLQVPIVAISNEKPVPSLRCLGMRPRPRMSSCNLKREARSLATRKEYFIQVLRPGCNLKREARSLATLRGGARGRRARRLQSQTRSPFPRYG